MSEMPVSVPSMNDYYKRHELFTSVLRKATKNARKTMYNSEMSDASNELMYMQSSNTARKDIVR